jgi:flagellar motility protein MotE (MotC chaperone)
MLGFAKLSKNMLLAGSVVLSAQLPAWAEPAPPPQPAKPAAKPSKPLNLAGFAKLRTAPHRLSVKPEPSPANPQPESPLTTAAIVKPGAPEPAAADQRESDTAQFCKNIADAALDARVAWQQRELEAAEAKLRQRIAELEAKRSEYEQWLKLRDDFLKKAEESVVEIYSRMNPEAAALQIASMADESAAAVLAKLRVRNASAILDEMEPARAAHLADTLAGMRRADDGKAGK